MGMFGLFSRTVDAENALPGRDQPVLHMPQQHRVFGEPLDKEYPDSEIAYLAAGCFWGVEKLYWQLDGVLSTAAGYTGGQTRNPTYKEVCSGRTGHAEAVRVVFDPKQISYADLLRVFFENHDPTQRNRQGNDVGTQYRSAIYPIDDLQSATAMAVRVDFQKALTEAGYPAITTDIRPAGDWYYAEGYHQQYLDANPGGYCPVHATGVTCNPS